MEEQLNILGARIERVKEGAAAPVGEAVGAGASEG
jgi:hypothetical protein